MTTIPVDDLWTQVAELRPQLRKGVRILVQDYRGERWYLLHDPGSGRFLRFNASAYEFLGRLDGDLSIQEILDLANTGSDDGAWPLEREDILQILAQLHGAEVLRGALPLGAQDVLNRYRQAQRYRRQRTLSNPLALRIPLFDPNPLLCRAGKLARWLFSWPGLTIWAGTVGIALVLGIAHLEELAAAVGDKTLGASEVVAFWLLYPFVKMLHEAGHALAVRAWGGEVHEVGINLLVFMPVPYVDASAAWAFRDKRRRALVGAAGIMTELFVAAVGLAVWLLVEPGLVRDVALNAVLIGAVSTLLFNGNPLLKFDGYYVMEDLVEVPNLASRSGRFYLYLIQRFLLGLKDARSPVTAPGEAAWFAFYGLASPLYRLTVLFGIAFYLAGEFLVVGIVLAAWAVFMQLVRPLFRALRFVVADARLAEHRMRGLAVLSGAILVVAALLTVPAPLVTAAQGVIWPDDRARVVSDSEGFVDQVLVKAGDPVEPGQLLLRLDDPELQARQQVLDARLQELRDHQAAERLRSRVRGAMVEDDIAAVRAEIEQVRQRVVGLTVRSRTGGRFYPVDPRELRGKLVRQGEVVGYVLAEQRPLVRAVVQQNRIGLLRSHPASAEVMLADRRGHVVPAELIREVPAGSQALPSSALGAAGGGDVAVDSRDEQGRTAAEKVFQIELALPEGTRVAGMGGRVYVRLDHGSEALWRQWTRALRQLLLSQLDI